MSFTLEELRDKQREIEIFLAKHPERRKEYERLIKLFVEALTPDTIIGPWKQ